ncbi:MAG: TonB family protein [Caulobacter sp.]
MAAARGVGPATVVSIGLHLLVVAALWRSPSPVVVGPAPVLEVFLAPALVARPASRPAVASPRPAAVRAKIAAAPRAPLSDGAGGAPATDAPSPASAPWVARPVDPAPAAPAPAPSSNRPAEDPLDAWSRQVWTAIDRRRPRGEAGATAARVAFSLDRSGRLTGLRLAGSSGAPRFDREAMRAVRAAAPFPPPPAGVDAAGLRFEIVIRSTGG